MYKIAVSALVFVLLSLVILSQKPAVTIAGDNVWTSTGPFGVRIFDVAIDPINSQVIYAAAADGNARVYKSTDAGLTWSPSGEGIPGLIWGFEFAFDPEDTRILYLATESGVYKSTSGGQSWELVGTVDVDDETLPMRAWSIAVSPLDGTVYVGAQPYQYHAPGGIYRSRDGGISWERLGNGAPTSLVNAIAVAPGAPHILYAGTTMETEGILRSMDGGDSWQPINGSFGIYPSVTHIAVDPYDSQVVYIGTQRDGIYKTINGGESWFPIGGGLGSTNIRTIVIDAGNQQIMYAGAGDTPGSGTPGVYTSTDNNGLSWTFLSDSMGARAVYSLAIDKNTPRNIYAGTSSGVWKYTVVDGPPDYSLSINDGALFTNQTAVTLTLTAPTGTTEMMVSNDGGFGGASWEPFAPQKTWVITSFGTYVLPRTVYAKFKTNGQISGLYQDDIVLDVTPPTGSVTVASVPSSAEAPISPGTTVAATDNKLYLPLAMLNARPGFGTVKLLFYAIDDVSGVGQMLIANDPSFADSVWEPYVAAKDWWVPDAPSSTTVYVKYRDRAGNTSIPYSVVVSP